MIEFSQIPTLVEWAKKHTLLAVMVVITGIFLYGGYAFVGGYATRFGETFVGSYGQFRRTVASYSLIDSLLRDCLTHFNASRVGVARFHNSVHDLGNNSMYFVSFETVVAAPGVASDIDEVANLSASVFSPILPQLLLDGKPVLLYTRDIEHSPMKELALRRGIKVALFVPIRDLSDRVIGMVTLSWLNEVDVPQGAARETMIRVMMEASSRIGGYFSATNWNAAHSR